jgi:hypothetical protein
MYSVNGQSTWNFFQNNFTNHIPAASGAVLVSLAHKFATATPYVQTVGLSDFANYTKTGAKVATPNYPWELTFVPSTDVNSLFPDNYTSYFTDQLKTVPVGSTLYHVYATSAPGAESKLIGDLVLQSALTTSYFGDKHMFFKH